MQPTTEFARKERLCERCGVLFIVLTDEDAQSNYCPVCRRLLPPPGQVRGLLRWFDWRKGFGIVLTRDGRNVYIRRPQIAPAQRRHLRRGVLLSLYVQKGKRGWEGYDVQWLPSSPAGDAPDSVGDIADAARA